MKQEPAPIKGFYEHFYAGASAGTLVWIDRASRPHASTKPEKTHRTVISYAFDTDLMPIGFSVAVSYRAYNTRNWWHAERGAYQSMRAVPYAGGELVAPTHGLPDPGLSDVILFDSYKYLLPLMQKRVAELEAANEIPWP